MKRELKQVIKVIGCVILVGLVIFMLVLIWKADTISKMDKATKGLESINKQDFIDKKESIKPIKNIEVSVDAMDLELCIGDEYGVEASYRKDTKFEYQVTGDTLVIIQEEPSKYLKDRNNLKRGVLNIYIPENRVLEKADIEIGIGKHKIKDLTINELKLESGLGEVKLDNIITDKAYIEGGMGEIIATNLASNDLDVEIGMGCVDIQGDLKNNIKVEGGMGELKLTTKGKESDYNYDISKGMGVISINEKEQNILENVKIDNRAKNNIIVEGGLGTISVNIE